MESSTIPAPTPVTLDTPTLTVGFSTYLGLAVTVLGALGALVAAIQSKDTALITAAATGLIAALGTIGSRTSQNNALVTAAAIGAPAARLESYGVNIASLGESIRETASQPVVDPYEQPVEREPADDDEHEDGELLEDPELDHIDEAELPSDEDEFSSGQPDENPESAARPDGAIPAAD